jgi:hypothetical protein
LATIGSARNASISERLNGGTRMPTTRDRIVGKSAPGSLDVRMIVVSSGGSSRSLRKAFAAWSDPSCATIRSASPITNTFRRASAGEIAAICTMARTVAT